MEYLRREPYYTRSGKKVERSLCKCECGHELLCAEFTNTCKCGRDYNMSGQLLAPRSQWGWDTGESVEDILSAGHHDESDL